MTADVYRSPCGAIELRLGRYQDVLADVEADAAILDAPYSERTHKGHDDGASQANRVRNWAANAGSNHPLARAKLGQVERFGSIRRKLNYGAWSRADVDECVASLCSTGVGWIVPLTDHVLAPEWAASLEAAGRYAFSPLACMEPGGRVRMTGDGPAQWSTLAVPSRPSDAAWLARWRASRKAAGLGLSLPGGYVVPLGQGDTRAGRRTGVTRILGGKPLWLMRAIIRDYSRPGDLVVDPCAGGATTLLAAAIEGRRAIGAECDPDTFAKAAKRLEKGYTPSLQWRPPRPERRPTQEPFAFPETDPPPEIEPDDWDEEEDETDYEPDDDYEPDAESCAR